MSLSKSSTLADALGQYNDNLSWEGDSAKALLFVQACRFLRMNRPQSRRDSLAGLDYESILKDQEKAEAYLQAVSDDNRATFVVGRCLQ